MKHLVITTLLLLFCQVRHWAREAPVEPPAGVSIRRDINFLAKGREEKLDLYEPATREPKRLLPAVVIIHGGGWVRGDKGRLREYVTGTSLAKAGYVAVSINYETRAGHRWPNNLHDCKNAVRWLRKNSERLGVDPERIGVIGGSAGGHLALMVAYTSGQAELSSDALYPGISDEVGACVNLYGITNLQTRKEVKEDGTPSTELKSHRLFPESREEAPGKWALASPVTHVHAKVPPTLTLHGTADPVVDRDQAKELHQALTRAGADSTLRLIDGAKHAWPLKTKSFDLTGEVVTFFDKHLKASEGQEQPSEAKFSSKEKTERRPNVLFIAVDDLNDWQTDLGGHPLVKTPHLDRLFGQGELFTNAHCSQAVCTASRNSLLSGLHPTTTGWYRSTKAMRESYAEVMGEHQMLPQYFRENGYRTMAVGKLFHQGVSDYRERTDDFWDETGPGYKVSGRLLARGDGYGGRRFYPFPKEGAQMSRHYGKSHEDGNSLACGPLDREDMPGGQMYDEIIAEWASGKLMEEHQEPFFLAVGFVRPHAPFTAPRPFYEQYDFEQIEEPFLPRDEMSDIPILGKSIAYGRLPGGDHHAVINLSETYWREMIHGYLASVSFVDAQIGKVIAALEESPYREDTIVVLWSDHGQHLGEKKHWRKQSLWEEATRVPLFFKVPGVTAAGGRNHEAVSLLDIYPTLVELCDLPPAPKLEGYSLVPLLQDRAESRPRPILMSWYYGNHAVRSRDWRYIRYRDGSEELYNHREDPDEFRNLAQRPEYAKLKSELGRWIPEEPALPAGMQQWKPDKLDRRVSEWEEAGAVPDWLK
ncbi:MAG: sulfatase-like hydrolase/transferase [Verrucomicrobiota bacterium JB023]|nr:sulfatase-like hydrolase/transferase [Verrucomicrobiota bacterium JB023]